MALDSLFPVWINILFIFVAQTLIWIFLVSNLFASDANRTIRALNRCFKLGGYAAPVTDEDVTDVLTVPMPNLNGMSPDVARVLELSSTAPSTVAKVNSTDLGTTIEEIPEPTIKGNMSSLQKLFILIGVAVVLVGVMVAAAEKSTRANLVWYVLVSLMAYTLEVALLYMVVIPYPQFGDAELVHTITDTSSYHSSSPP